MNESKEQINFRTLRRIEPDIKDIVISAGQVAIYKFNGETNEWVRKEIEGSMFVIRKKVAPHFAVVVINRLNTTNLLQLVTSDVDIKLQSPYLMFKNQQGEIFCIWFYDNEECSRAHSKLEEAIALSKNASFIDLDDNPTNNSFVNSLSNTPHKTPNKQVARQPQTNVMETLLGAHRIEQDNKQKNLSKDKNEQKQILKRHDNEGNDRQKKISIDIQTLFQNQTSAVAQSSTNTNTNPNPNIITNINTSTPKQRPQSKRNTPNDKVAIRSSNTNPIESPNGNGNGNGEECVIIDYQYKGSSSTVKPVQVMDTQHHQVQNPISYSQAPLPSQLPSSLIQRFSGPSNLNLQVTPLTMEQLKQTMIYLLQNDADFLHAIHTAYSKQFSNQK